MTGVARDLVFCPFDQVQLSVVSTIEKFIALRYRKKPIKETIKHKCVTVSSEDDYKPHLPVMMPFGSFGGFQVILIPGGDSLKGLRTNSYGADEGAEKT